jgi:hypothetical protein
MGIRGGVIRRKAKVVSASLMAIAAAAWVLTACGATAEEPRQDTALRASSITGTMTMSQLDSATVHGAITVSVASERWMRSVRFVLDGSVIATVARAPYRVTIDTTQVAEGGHVLVAEPLQANGTVRNPSTAIFTVRNAPSRPALTWAPPTLDAPITRHVGVTGGLGTLDASRDYVLVMPSVPRTEALVINGGRNVVLIGGEVAIPDQGTSPTITSRRALYIANSTGTVHVEGLLLHGDDISEGIQINAPAAIVQIQNVAIRNVHARDQVRFSDNHPDVLQTWGGVGELRVDGLTGESDYQGLFFKADYNGPHGPVHLRNVNLRAMPTTRYQFWMDGTGGGYPTVTLSDVWVEPAPNRSFGKTVWPDVDHAEHPVRIAEGAASWPTLPVSGVVRQGTPPGGDFVPVATVGLGYASPGYGSGR